ncbi:MAG: hypothetical protein C4522_15970 [Desulfobacteraceae bacterium]|nr:MAG: hypothetical protein C4522_15970 [Desulfobacteraceae bacterium]
MAYELIEFDKVKDKNRIIPIWKEAMGSHLDRRYEWIYNTLPLTRPTTVLLKNIESNRIVGCGSILQKIFFIDNKPFTVGICVDFFVNAEHRTLGPAVMIQRWITSLLQAYPIDFLFAFPNQMALSAFIRVGYKKLGTVETFVKLLKAEEKLKQYVKYSFLSKIIAFPVNKIEWIVDYFRLLAVGKKYTAEICHEPDDRFNTLISSTINRSPIFLEKNREILKWRFSDTPGTDNKFFCLTDISTGKLAGYLVYSIENRVAYIQDLLLQDMDADLKPLILFFSKEMRKEENVNSIRICYIGNSHILKNLKELFFVKRTNDRYCLVYTRKDMPEDVKNTIFSLDKWFLLEGDMDI